KRAEQAAARPPASVADSAGAPAAASDPMPPRPPLAIPRVEPATSGRVLEAVRASRAPVTMVNVWATWCPPCREEFPDLVRFERDWRGRGVRVILVSADFEDQLPEVRAFLARHGVTAASWIKS